MSGRVGFSLGLTINLGGYENIRCQVDEQQEYTGGTAEREAVFAALAEDVRKKLYAALRADILDFRRQRRGLTQAPKPAVRG